MLWIMLLPSPAPRYQQLAEHVRAEILSGAYAFGARLPSETDLARRFGVSRGTVIKAFDLLVKEGMVVRRQGAGTFVTRASLRRKPGRLSSFSETVAAHGKQATQRIMSLDVATDAQCRSVGCFEPAIRLTRLRLVDGVTSSIHTALVPQSVIDAIPPDHAARLRDATVTDFSLYAALEAAGIQITRAVETVTSRLAQTTEATALSIEMPAAVMVVNRRSTDAAGRLIEVTEAVYQSGYYTYEVPLERGASHATPFQITTPPPPTSDSQEDQT